ncbi:hypothetical protein ATO3_23345 [Marinibacterium profundimaris]|uniref:Uncharacterized protein n=1 Tax=Marinibacterium profundimaris TaxID=1679460 RepID=A0A225NGZ3_9RHOB|nr:hypothetical protein ATO3_23345 [Marinibacterium profundimaris]
MQAQNFLGTPGGARVYPINDNVFEVVGNSGYGYDLWWCGASEYARRVLGAGWGTPVTIARSLGTSQATGRRSSVQFTLNPAALGIDKVTSYSPNALVVGDTKTVQTGNMSCPRLNVPLRFR